MYQLYTEKYLLDGRRSLSWYLARHIFNHMAEGKMIVVTDKPSNLLSSTRKQWFKLMRQLRRERSSTLAANRIDYLLGNLALMQGLTFSAKPPEDLLEADITFATAEDFVCTPPICHTAFITYGFEREKLHMLTSWLPKGSLVVFYHE